MSSKPLPGQEAGDARRDHDVLVQERPVEDARAEVEADLLADAAAGRAGSRGLPRLVEAQVVRVEDALQLGGQLEVDAEAREHEARVHEVRLALELVASAGWAAGCPGAFSSTSVWVRAMPERLQKLKGPPAKFELS